MCTTSPPPGSAGAWGGGSVTHTDFEDQPWWEVDLGAVEQIDEIAIWGRTDSCCVDRLSDYYVLVSDEPFASDSLDEVLAQPGVWANQQADAPTPKNAIDVGETGRYVRVQLAGNDALSLAEVQVFTADGPLYLWNADTEDFASAPGNGIRGAVDDAGTLWFVNSENAIYRLDRNFEMTRHGDGIDVATGTDGSVWKVSTDGELQRRLGDDDWEPIGGEALARLDVAADGDVWLLDEAGQILRYDRTEFGVIQSRSGVMKIVTGLDGSVWLVDALPDPDALGETLVLPDGGHDVISVEDLESGTALEFTQSRGYLQIDVPVAEPGSKKERRLFEDGVVEMGHDGPAHLAISDSRPRLRGLGLYHGKRGFGVSVEFSVGRLQEPGVYFPVEGDYFAYLRAGLEAGVPTLLSEPTGTASDWAAMAYLGVFQVGLAYVLLTSALRTLPARANGVSAGKRSSPVVIEQRRR